MTSRCASTCEVRDHTLQWARRLPCADHGEVDWAFLDDLQCLLGEAEHEFHATWLRSGSELERDVYLCWLDEPDMQWVVDAEVCLKTERPLGSGCTIYKGHPGTCEWEHTAPVTGESPDDGQDGPTRP
ncbi:hypothetical protein AB0E62_07185 [Streptomyces sp. NPDC038707]|uniref:hypothetical protein n=1 Tax=Streptomyces sp. NPDC038707 TaxID=3154329 RepID=UPI0033DE8786